MTATSEAPTAVSLWFSRSWHVCASKPVPVVALHRPLPHLPLILAAGHHRRVRLGQLLRPATEVVVAEAGMLQE